MPISLKWNIEKTVILILLFIKMFIDVKLPSNRPISITQRSTYNFIGRGKKVLLNRKTHSMSLIQRKIYSSKFRKSTIFALLISTVKILLILESVN